MNSIEDIQRMIAERVASESAGSIPGDESPNIDSGFITECLRANELGDAQLFIALNKGLRLYNETIGDWMVWKGHYWDIDRDSADALAFIEDVALIYHHEAHTLVDKINNEKDTDTKNKLIDLQKMLYNRITRLRSVRGTNNCLTFARRCHNRLIIKNEDFDKNPWLLPVINGVVDLKTGDLLPGSPSDLLMKHCQHEWTGITTPCPVWEKTLLEIMDGDVEMVEFLSRLFGYSITGLISEQKLPILWGKGRNGKGTIIETINYILGDYSVPVKPEMLMLQSQSRNSSGPNPDIMALKGARIAFASESDEGKRIDVNMVKRLTGGDTLTGRCPHDKYETKFEPTHKLFLLTNNLPKAPSHDYAFWQRVILIPFNLSYVDDPVDKDERKKDKHLMEKLKKEASGILAWFVRGCLKWQESGLDVPGLVSEQVAGYRKKEDVLADFIEACCLVGDGLREKSSSLYVAYKEWFEDNYGKRLSPMSHKKFGELMGRSFQSKKSGVYYFIGIQLSNNTDD